MECTFFLLGFKLTFRSIIQNNARLHEKQRIYCSEVLCSNVVGGSVICSNYHSLVPSLWHGSSHEDTFACSHWNVWTNVPSDFYLRLQKGVSMMVRSQWLHTFGVREWFHAKIAAFCNYGNFRAELCVEACLISSVKFTTSWLTAGHIWKHLPCSFCSTLKNSNSSFCNSRS